MGQRDQFHSEDYSPDAWVRRIESMRIGELRWRDGSWGNNAAPSWELMAEDRALAEVFYYTVANAERVTKRFPQQPYVTVLIFGEGEEIETAFELSPEDMLTVLSDAGTRDVNPHEALKAALAVAEDAERAFAV